jgi:hypothetical protein
LQLRSPSTVAVPALSQLTQLIGRSTLLHQLLMHVARIITIPVTHATYMLVAEAQVIPAPSAPFPHSFTPSYQSLLLSLLLPSVVGGASGAAGSAHSHVHAAMLSPDVTVSLPTTA